MRRVLTTVAAPEHWWDKLHLEDLEVLEVFRLGIPPELVCDGPWTAPWPFWYSAEILLESLPQSLQHLEIGLPDSARGDGELREELLKSEKLTRFFEDNPSELHHLRHDGELKPARTQAHLRHVPDYLLPAEGKKALTADQIGFVPFKKADQKNRRSKFYKGKTKKVSGRKSDPPRTFKARKKTT